MNSSLKLHTLAQVFLKSFLIWSLEIALINGYDPLDTDSREAQYKRFRDTEPKWKFELKFYDSMTNVLHIKVTDIMSFTNHLKGESLFSKSLN